MPKGRVALSHPIVSIPSCVSRSRMAGDTGLLISNHFDQAKAFRYSLMLGVYALQRFELSYLWHVYTLMALVAG